MEVYNICDVGRIITEKSLALGRGSLFYRKSWFGGSAKTICTVAASTVFVYYQLGAKGVYLSRC